MRRTSPLWHQSPYRANLLALYAEADALLAGWACACTTHVAPEARCCRFDLTGREPHATAVELEEVRHAMRARGLSPRGPRSLPLEQPGPCPLLSEGGRCRVYAARPFGCRTFFCREAEAPYGSSARPPRDAVNAIGRRIADLSARFAPLDPHPRPLVRALAKPGVTR